MKKVYYLKTCSTCRGIIKEYSLKDSFELQDIKSQPLTTDQLEHLKELSGSYASLFSKRSREYQARNLKNKTLNESDFKHLILEHYSFLKRPVIINGDKIIIGRDTDQLSQLTSI